MMASDGSWGDQSDKHEDSTASSKLQNKTSSISEDIVTVLSRNGSLSSLSVDSFGSTEPTPSEQALLEQCISSGMPKSKSEVGTGKARIAVPVTAKKKIGGGVCKIPLATGDHQRQGEEERPSLVIPSVPMQKLELKPLTRTHCVSYRENDGDLHLGVIENGLACLNLQDDSSLLYSYDIKQIPKNGVDPSAVISMKEAAADVEGNIAATGSILNRQDHVMNSMTLPENSNIANSSKIVDIDQQLPQSRKILQYSTEGESRKCQIVAEVNNSLDFALKITKKTTEIYHSNKIESPGGSTSDDKSPFSSGESPSADFYSDGKLEDCDRKEQDADAVIASPDCLTGDILQQTQDMCFQKEKNRDPAGMKQSLVGSDTWNEDTSPNDISFPSMSISAPLVASFKSDNHEDAASTLPELAEEGDLISKTSEEQQASSLTDSHMIEVEAGKLAVAVQAEGQNLPYASAEEMEHSLTSLNSVDLDAIKPPSMMGSLVSLTTSLSGQLDNTETGETRERCNSSSLPPHQPRNNGTRLECRHSRKKSLPAGMMVRRALGNSNHNGSIENLQDNTSVSSSCNSHLDNIKPPSAMEELIDIVDMENSMVSVASITSEVADSSAKEQSNSEQSPGNSDAMFDLLKPAASVMAEVYAAQYPAAAMSVSVRTSSASDCLDNINPPSAFNEVADLADPESIVEPGTETICSDTEMYTEEPGYTHSIEKLDKVDSPELLSDSSRKATPVPSDQCATSSAESTPRKHKHKQLTPKQKRQLVKERYKTYTITAEEEMEKGSSTDVKKIEGKLPLPQSNVLQVCDSEIQSFVEDSVDLKQPLQEKESPVKEKNQSKVTPKQRRLEDRQRFQTQVLDKSPPIDSKQEVVADIHEGSEMTGDSCQRKEILALEQLEQHRFDVAKQKLSRTKTLKQKRAEAKERFRTRTLSEENAPQKNHETNLNGNNSQPINANYESSEFILTGYGAETLAVNNSEVGFVEALLNVTPEEIESLLERDASIVITTLNDARRCNSESSELPSSDEMLLECETLSLISIDSESDQNSNFCRMGKRRGSDLIGRESSVNEEPGMSHTQEAFTEAIVKEKLCEETEVIVDDRISVKDSEESQEDEGEGFPKTRGPRIVKPEEKLKRDESADSNYTDEGSPQGNSPKAVRGRRKALYSSTPIQKQALPPISYPTTRKIRSSIPVSSGQGKSMSATNVRSTKASALRQSGRGSSCNASQRSISRTPPSSAESRSPRNTSPKTARTARAQSRNIKCASPPTKMPLSRNSTIPSTSDKERGENDTKDPKLKPLERQGTFTKDETVSTKVAPPSPTKTKIPVPATVTSNTKLESKLKKPSSNIKPSSCLIPASKSKSHREISAPMSYAKSAQSRFMKTHSQESDVSDKQMPAGNSKSLMKAATIPGRNGTACSPRLGYKRNSVGSQEGIKSSVSNQSLQSNDGGKAPPKEGLTHPQRSSSNCSLSSVTSGGGSSKKKVSKKEVTSKIASLWKRVEESKNKQKAVKEDTRVWITSTPDEAVDIESNINSTELLTDGPPISRLVRSSTFEGLPSKLASNNGIDDKTRTHIENTNVSKMKMGMKSSKLPSKCESKSNFNSDFRKEETSIKIQNPQKQVAEVTGMVVVQPMSRVIDGSQLNHMNKEQDESLSQEVVLRRHCNEAKLNGSEIQDCESDTPKRLSRLGSFIRIDPPEEGGATTAEGKSTSKLPASAIVQPFNYNPPSSTVGSHIPTPVTSISKRSESYLTGIGNIEEARRDQAEVLDEHVQEFNTASMRVTTV